MEWAAVAHAVLEPSTSRRISGATTYGQANIGMPGDSAAFNFGGAGAVNGGYNAADETTATGGTGGSTGSLNSQSAGAFSFSVSVGAEDFHLRAGSNAIGAADGLGLGSGVYTTDPDGYDVDAAGDPCDMAADQRPVSASTNAVTVGTSSRDVATWNAWVAQMPAHLVGAGTIEEGQCYADGVSTSISRASAPRSSQTPTSTCICTLQAARRTAVWKAAAS